MATRKPFPLPKSLQAVRKRCDKPLNDKQGTFKVYMAQVNTYGIDNDSPDTKIIAEGLFKMTQTSRKVGPFIINW
jgi:hypothetical protein